MSLTLSRKEGESIMIGNDIVVTVTKNSKGQVKLAVDAPKELSITRPGKPRSN